MKSYPDRIFYGLIIFLIAVGLILFVYANVKIVGYKDYDIDYTVGDYVGINLDEDAIHFGTAHKGTTHRRYMKISTDRDVFVKIILYDIEYIIIEEADFLLHSGETKNVPLLLNLPLNAEDGHYSGKLKVVFLKT